MAKVHLLLSREPDPLGKTAIARCSALVLYPKAEMWVELGQRRLPERDPLRDCKQCWAAVERDIGTNEERLYLYAIRSGEETIHGND